MIAILDVKRRQGPFGCGMDVGKDPRSRGCAGGARCTPTRAASRRAEDAMGTASFPKFGVVSTSFPASRGGSWWARSTRAWWPLLVDKVVQMVRGEVSAIHYDDSHRMRRYALSSYGLITCTACTPLARISPSTSTHTTHFTTWLCPSAHVPRLYVSLPSTRTAMDCSMSTISITLPVCPRCSQALHWRHSRAVALPSERGASGARAARHRVRQLWPRLFISCGLARCRLSRVRS